MIRLLQGILALTLAGTAGATQINAPVAPQQTAAAEDAEKLTDKAELFRRIAQYETAARNNEAAHADRLHLARIYRDLGNLCADAGLYLKAEDAMKHAVTDMKNGSQTDLAEELGQLAVVHVELGKFKQAEQDEMEALRIRGLEGDPLRTADTWRDLSSLYSVQHKFKKAADYAQKAFGILGNREDISAYDRVAIRQSLGYALTGINNCAQGIPILKDALDLARHSFGEPGLRVGYAEYLLGLGYWHCGDRDHAAEWLESGTAQLKADFGWDRSVYLNAMGQYARFLRSTGQPEAAASAEAVVNQSDATVDARSLTRRAEGFRESGAK
jgi:hypothetical protein